MSFTECVSDKEIAENLRNFLFQNRFDELLDCIEAYINSSEDKREKAKLQELYRYYSENKEALAGYRDRGISIPPTRNPDEVFHANLGSMEGNVFTIIGNRMKGRRACWSVAGGNRLAALLCKHYSVSVNPEAYVAKVLMFLYQLLKLQKKTVKVMNLSEIYLFLQV